jgi:adenosylcobinamide-GDP ribazoletransferase
MRALVHEARLALVALQYFTRLPVPALPQFDARWLSQAVRYFPLAGLIVGALTALVLYAAAIALPWPLATALALAASLVITGAFHEDGLADTVDALGGHVTRERALEIMRDSRIGTYGAAALMLALLVRWQALVALRLPEAVVLLVAGHAASRAAAALLMAGLPYVRLDVDAKAKPVAQPMGIGQAIATAAIGLLPIAGVIAWQPRLAPSLVVALVALALVQLLCRRWLRRRLGGYTGDGLGATQQFTEIAFALAWITALRTGL